MISIEGSVGEALLAALGAIPVLPPILNDNHRTGDTAPGSRLPPEINSVLRRRDAQGPGFLRALSRLRRTLQETRTASFVHHPDQRHPNGRRVRRLLGVRPAHRSSDAPDGRPASTGPLRTRSDG